jgi:hypothetical protein
MDRPLWQIMLAILFVGVAAQRAAVGFALAGAEVEPSLFAAYCLQGAAAIAAAIGVWAGRPWAIGAVLALGATLVAGALLESFWLGVRPAITAVSQMLIVALSTGALALVLRRELRAEPHASSNQRRETGARAGHVEDGRREVTR